MPIPERAAQPGSDDDALSSIEDLTCSLEGAGDADFDRQFSILYRDLRRIAARWIRGEREGHTLSATSLVHEAYLKLAQGSGHRCRNRAQFLAFISRAMRQILVDHARRRGAQKRGGPQFQVTFQTYGAVRGRETLDLLELDDALDQLASREPRLRTVVECRFFGGMSPEETAEALGVTRRTVDRDWVRARAYLYQLLATDGSER